MYRRATAYTLPPTHDNLVLEDSCGSVSIVFMRIIRRTCFNWNFKNQLKKLFFLFLKKFSFMTSALMDYRITIQGL